MGPKWCTLITGFASGPGALLDGPGIKAMMAENYYEGGTHSHLLFDVRKAQGRVLVLEDEWGRQACRVKGSAAATAQARRSRTEVRVFETGANPGPAPG